MITRRTLLTGLGVIGLAAAVPTGYFLTRDPTSDRPRWDRTPILMGKPLTYHHPTRGVFSIEFSPDSTIVAVGGVGAGLQLWDVATRTRMLPITDIFGGVQAVAFSPDGKILATGSQDGDTRLWQPSPKDGAAASKRM